MDKPPKTDQESKAKWLRGIGLLSIIVGDLVGFTGAGLGLGYLAWTKLHTSVWAMVLGGLVGLTLSMVKLYQLTKKDL
jgi:F0F1-type ATP synthase assembly protein I